MESANTVPISNNNNNASNPKAEEVKVTTGTPSSNAEDDETANLNVPPWEDKIASAEAKQFSQKWKLSKKNNWDFPRDFVFGVDELKWLGEILQALPQEQKVKKKRN